LAGARGSALAGTDRRRRGVQRWFWLCQCRSSRVDGWNVGGLAALRDNKPALARVLFQQTLRKAPGFEGALFYLAQLK